jgi:predicted amidohydrolase YtcJ
MSEPFSPQPFSGVIQNCYDSHVHWLGTGQWARDLRLHPMRDPETDLKKIIESAPRLAPAGETSWLTGRGWDQNLFLTKTFPTHEMLDRHFADRPVYFVRVDGHAAWVNRRAFELAGLWHKNPISPEGGAILLKSDGYPSGVVLDQAMGLFEKLLPRPGRKQIEQDLLRAQKIFNDAGFTHIRDMSCDSDQWAAACAIEARGELTLAVEQMFSAENPERFHEQLRFALEARRERQNRPQSLLRVAGVKIYADGALGSEGAWLSQPYQGAKNALHPHGLQLLSQDVLIDCMVKAWQNQMPLAVHALGDAAVDFVVNGAIFAREKYDVNGLLHLEHVEVLRLETIEKMKSLRVMCHMQPCHYLSDRRWLKEKLGALTSEAFRWAALEKNEIPISMGSDSPIEPVSLQRNIDAMMAAAEEGIAPTTRPVTTFQSHPDLTWVPNTQTRFVDGQIVDVIFAGQKLVSN